MKTISKVVSIIAATAAMTAVSAQAEDATGTLVVDALVNNVCNVATTPVSFANVGLTSTTANGSITVTCTNTGSFTVALDGGGSGDIDNREMTGPLGATLGYQLYTEAANINVWGDGAKGDTQTGQGPTETFTVYGATTTTPTASGAYTDSVTVTVTY